MKAAKNTVITFLPLVFCVIAALVIVINLVGRQMGYQLVLYHDILESAIAAILLLSLTIYLFVGKIQLNALNQIMISLFEVVFGEFGQTSVVRQVPSPDHSLTAEIVDVDLGATGGNTLVRLSPMEGEGIPVLIGKLVRAKVVVYEGRWGEFETMNLYWKDDQTLVIDGTEYKTE